MPETAGRLKGMLSLYPVATRLAEPLVGWHLNSRVRRGKEDALRLAERRGVSATEREPGSLIWIHGASVGESLSVLPLITWLRKTCPDARVMVTTGTVTSARLLEQRLPEGAFHQYVPLDHPAYVERFLTHWRPSLALWIESEFWPNLLSRAAAKGVPLVLLNARMSDKSYRGWQRFSASIRGMLSQFDLCLAQDDGIGARLSALGASNVVTTGNLKLCAPPLPVEEAALAALSGDIGARPVWLAASTHDEESAVLNAHRLLAERYPGLLTIIAPRQPDRGAAIAELARDKGITAARRSLGEPVTAETGCYIADTIGEMGLFFRLSGISFMGRSLVPLGGSNPLEAARLDSAVLTGPETDNFRVIYGALTSAGGAIRVQGAGGLSKAVGQLLSDEAARQELVAKAKPLVEQTDQVLDRVTQALEPFIAPLREDLSAPEAP